MVGNLWRNELDKIEFNKNIIVYIVSSSIAAEDKKSKTYSDIGYLSKPISINDLELIILNE
jgi:hypothetical protein